jgi:hypothetical protein
VHFSSLVKEPDTETCNRSDIAKKMRYQYIAKQSNTHAAIKIRDRKRLEGRKKVGVQSYSTSGSLNYNKLVIKHLA